MEEAKLGFQRGRAVFHQPSWVARPSLTTNTLKRSLPPSLFFPFPLPPSYCTSKEHFCPPSYTHHLKSLPSPQMLLSCASVPTSLAAQCPHTHCLGPFQNLSSPQSCANILCIVILWGALPYGQIWFCSHCSISEASRNPVFSSFFLPTPNANSLLLVRLQQPQTKKTQRGRFQPSLKEAMGQRWRSIQSGEQKRTKITLRKFESN